MKFKEKERHLFMRKNGRLFSSMERQRLMYSIMEGPHHLGGAQIHLNELVVHGHLSAVYPLHSSEREALCAAWLGVRLWPTGWPHGWPCKLVQGSNPALLI